MGGFSPCMPLNTPAHVAGRRAGQPGMEVIRTLPDAGADRVNAGPYRLTLALSGSSHQVSTTIP